MRRFSRSSRRFVTSVPARTNSYQLVPTCTRRFILFTHTIGAFGHSAWYEVRTTKSLVRDCCTTSVNSSISHPRLTRGSYTSYFTLQISNITTSSLRIRGTGLGYPRRSYNSTIACGKRSKSPRAYELGAVTSTLTAAVARLIPLVLSVTLGCVTLFVGYY